ncbi:MAG: YraN family protein [Aeromonas sp.]
MMKGFRQLLQPLCPHLLPPAPTNSGKAFEQKAQAWLSRQGLTLVCANFRCRGGEIDLIMRDGHCLLFIEVKYRQSRAYGGAISAVTAAKQRKIRHAAQVYLQQQGYNEAHQACRFDVIAFDGDTPQWLKNAF